MSRPLRHLVRTALACGAVAILAGCGAEVKAFSAVPRHICAGERVDVRWSVAGSPRIAVTPPSATLPDGPVSKEGHATIEPSTNTRVELHVTRPFGHPTTSVQEVLVTTGSTARLTASLGDPAAQPGCRGGRVWASVHAKRFSSEVEVATVASHPGDDRTYQVEHAGIHAIVTPGAPSSDFAGKPLAGDWLLSSPIGKGETCATVPRVLVIDAVTRCREGGADDAR
jgi:hypothetical protein